MGLLDRLGLRRTPSADVALAAPRPPAGAVEQDRRIGTYGGPTSPFTVDRMSKIRTLQSRSQLTSGYVNDMRRHHQVSAALIVQSLAITGAEWVVECDDDDVRDTFTAWLDRVMPHLMRSSARALWAGYSPNTLVWGLMPDGLLAPRAFRDLDPLTCKPITDDAGSYRGFVQNQGRDNEALVEPLDSFWLVEGMESGNLYGRSLLEAAFIPWRDQQVVNLFHLRYLERFGEPITVARVPSGMTVQNMAEVMKAQEWNAAHPDEPVPVPDMQTVDNRLAGLNLAEGLRNHTQVALPSDVIPNAEGKALGYAWDLEFLESSRTTSPEFAAKIAEQDKAIARAMFMPDLLLGDGGGVGSFALSATHRDTWSEQVRDRLSDYAGQINEHLVGRVAQLNYGDNRPAVTLRFAPVQDMTDQLWPLVVGLVERGELPVDAVAIAASVGLPVPENVDELLADAAPAGEGLRRREVVDLDRHGHRLAVGDPGNLPEWRQPQEDKAAASWSRRLTDREKRVNFRGLEDGLNDAEASTIARLEELLEKSRSGVLRQVAGILNKGGTVADVVSAFSTINVGASGPYADAWIELQRTLWSLGLSSVAAELNAPGVPGKPGRDGEAIIRSLANTAAAKVTGALSSMVAEQVLAAYRSGVSQAGIAAAVSDLYDREVRGESRGPRLTTRQLAARAVNEGRADAIQRGGIPLRGAQYSALLDRRTCDLCERLDEQLIGIGDLDYAKFSPPLHYNCRCVWVYVTMDEADFVPNWTGAPASMVDAFGGFVIT